MQFVFYLWCRLLELNQQMFLHYLRIYFLYLEFELMYHSDNFNSKAEKSFGQRLILFLTLFVHFFHKKYSLQIQIYLITV